MVWWAKYVWRGSTLAFGIATFAGIPIPKDYRAMTDWLTAIDVWVINNAAFPSLFALSVGLMIGTVFVPSVLGWIKRQNQPPRLVISYDPNDPDCITSGFRSFEMSRTPTEITVLRAKVSSVGGNAPGCIAHATCTKVPDFEDKIIDPIMITFAPGYGADGRRADIREGSPAFLNLLVLTSSGSVVIPTFDLGGHSIPSSRKSEAGTYTFHYAVTSDSASPGNLEITLDWDRNHKNPKTRVIQSSKRRWWHPTATRH